MKNLKTYQEFINEGLFKSKDEKRKSTIKKIVTDIEQQYSLIEKTRKSMGDHALFLIDGSGKECSKKDCPSSKDIQDGRDKILKEYKYLEEKDKELHSVVTKGLAYCGELDSKLYTENEINRLTAAIKDYKKRGKDSLAASDERELKNSKDELKEKEEKLDKAKEDFLALGKEIMGDKD